MANIRDKSIKIRVTSDELELLHQNKVGGELATWMREVCLGKKTKRRNPPINVDPALLRHLAAIGNNLNQVARQCNKNLATADALDVIIRLDAIEEQLKVIGDLYAR